ncbi:amidohydrolase family protein [Chelativorans sp. ZYF759]|uniref:amidohydrolase family protein n=1 Tax=Chelativorans sp. ZYF759 TaxID=2692213 RepID=UPI00145C9297|nr:amidohydrolase [Chelativorans sp. ZYF759]NMG39648.1 amidohydrolase family protein [Chelativorans sp. ZYF759]
MSKRLIVNAWVLAVDEAMCEHRPGWIHIEDDRIVALGGGEPPAIPGAEILDVEGDIVLPGMVNPHCHMPMSLFRGLGEDVDDRLFRYMLPLERKFVSPEMVRIGSRLAAYEMIAGGVTTVADMYYHETEIGKVIDEAGMRGVVGQTLADFDPPDHKDFEEGFALAGELVETFADHPRVTPSIAPHAPYSTGPAVMERVAQWAADHGDLPIQIHLAETEAESAWARKEHGVSTVELAMRTGILRPKTVCAHFLLVDDADIRILAESGAAVAHNARSNGKGGRGMARVDDMRAAGIAVGIATDGAMSGNTLDLFSQFGVVSIFAKIRGQSRKPMPARDVIRMATLEGARVLGMDAAIGSLEPGKQADLIRIDLAAARLHPIYDPYAMLVFSSMPTDVRDVMVAGEWILRDRTVTTLEKASVMRDALQMADRFRLEIAAIDAGLDQR